MLDLSVKINGILRESITVTKDKNEENLCNIQVKVYGKTEHDMYFSIPYNPEDKLDKLIPVIYEQIYERKTKLLNLKLNDDEFPLSD